ncbi:MAG TPA: VapC toxin family PIN domain ribonuclease [Deltaproteobacteria bacterium]|nr:MAG: twitching motility protein PilT [Deltaproteobacteria bacterium GWB2_42_7]OGP38145.1 MAG: twitching motility protein PilT [Deltaproteobacteria bacterium GWD2_42_10]OGP47179.1 MAG: twitching motility protein PilT [Deltaproteobacteria bacterium GWF2_42_12]OGQ25274.1 MAG: twitching motility protein PilT [Deltaproteobacteria bacterium RIFCSPHIGHO2_02_FULL_42_44]OGQ68195.1 MAG: twitching motility protein PilT [Deltaproteobacteria bacterium RIFCSPLOWO2_12_FULL_42_16]OGQ73539.1 MAG: twitching 
MYPPSLLDTDILSELFKGHSLVKAKAAEYIGRHKRLTISQIAKYEILKGLKSKKAFKQIEIFNRFCSVNIVFPITDDVIGKASDIYAELKEEGSLISDADILVAATAIVNNLVLVTNNTNHFSRIKKLQLDNWKI